MPRKCTKTGCAPRRCREALQQPVASLQRSWVATGFVQQGDTWSMKEVGEDLDTELNPGEKGRGVGYAARPGLSRCPRRILACTTDTLALAGHRRIPPSLRAVHGNGCDAMCAGESIDSRCGCRWREIQGRPCDHSRHGLCKAVSIEPDQRGSDVSPAPTGQVNAEYGSPLLHHGDRQSHSIHR